MVEVKVHKNKKKSSIRRVSKLNIYRIVINICVDTTGIFQLNLTAGRDVYYSYFMMSTTL